MDSNDLLAENRRLKAEVESLRREISVLTQKLTLVYTHKTLAKGMQGESLVVHWVNGVITTHNANHDITVNGSLIRIEVKYSGLNAAIRGHQTPDVETLRWAWAKPFGESGNKAFNRLILVGDKDPRYFEHYKDPACPYIFFDVPYEEIMPLTIQTNSGRYRSIQLTTNPLKAKSSASPLFHRFQITLADLERCYGL